MNQKTRWSRRVKRRDLQDGVVRSIPRPGVLCTRPRELQLKPSKVAVECGAEPLLQWLLSYVYVRQVRLAKSSRPVLGVVRVAAQV